MNKKLATLLFAIGIGAAAAPAFAGQCQAYCQNARMACEATVGVDPATCSDNFMNCMAEC
jgi:hypothetical protein